MGSGLGFITLPPMLGSSRIHLLSSGISRIINLFQEMVPDYTTNNGKAQLVYFTGKGRAFVFEIGEFSTAECVL